MGNIKKIDKHLFVLTIKELSLKYKLQDILNVLNVPKSNYYRWLEKSKDKDENIISKIKIIVKDNKYRYGYRRVHSALKSEYGIYINHKKVLKIMNEYNLLAKTREKKFKLKNGNYHQKLDDLINRDFKSDTPNKKWYTDITMLKSKEVRLYLSTIIDGYNNEVISYNFSESPNVEFVLKTLNKACDNSQYNNLILHSDQGSTYTAYAFQEQVKEKNINQSMSRVGVCYDNVQIESFFSHLKEEIFYSPDNLLSKKELIEIVNEYMYYYNNNRIQMKLKEMSPVQYRKHFSK